MASDQCPECVDFEGIWVALYCIFLACSFVWFLWSPRSTTASNGTSAAGSTVATSLPSAQRRPRPPPKYLDPIALTRGLGEEYPPLGSRQHRYLTIQPARPVLLPGSDLKKPFVAERHWPQPIVRGRWETGMASALPPKKPTVADGAEYARTLANLRAALWRPGASDPFVPPQGLIDATTPKPTSGRIRPSEQPPYAPLKFTTCPIPSLTGARPGSFVCARPQPRRLERAVPPSPLISPAQYTRPVVPPKQKWFS